MRTRVLAVLLVLAFAAPAFAEARVNQSLFGTAVKGTDVVAYFTQGRAVAGSKEHTHEWQGATWRFASAEHRDLFAADPEKYAPQYGGFCAYAVALGATADIDPEAWNIHEGKLYLNKNKSIQERWQRDIPGYVEKADGHWPRLSGVARGGE